MAAARDIDSCPPVRLLMAMPALDMSGIAFAVQNLITGLARHGCQIFLLAAAAGEREASFRNLGIKLHVARYFGLPLLGRRAYAEAAAFRPDIVHAQCLSVARRALRLADDLRLPLVITINRLDIDKRDREFLCHHRDIGIIAVSDAIQAHMASLGISRERVAAIPNCLDLTQFPRPDLDNPPPVCQTPVVGTYGTLAERKGQRIFLAAAAEVLRRGVDAEFLIIGQGPDKGALRALAEELKISHRVTFSPSTSTDIRNLAKVDIFVEPTLQEGLGLSVLQAMASGVPVVASGAGGIYTLVKDGETGLLVPKGDPKAMADAICFLLAAPEKRLDLARLARERIEREFAAEKVAREVLVFYAGRLAAARRPGAA